MKFTLSTHELVIFPEPVVIVIYVTKNSTKSQLNTN